MSRPHMPHISLADRFIGHVFAAFIAKAVHRDEPGETALGPIVDHGEFAGPVDGYRPDHAREVRHCLGEVVAR